MERVIQEILNTLFPMRGVKLSIDYMSKSLLCDMHAS